MSQILYDIFNSLSLKCFLKLHTEGSLLNIPGRCLITVLRLYMYRSQKKKQTAEQVCLREGLKLLKFDSQSTALECPYR